MHRPVERPDPGQRIVDAIGELHHLRGDLAAGGEGVRRPDRVEVVAQHVGQDLGVAGRPGQRRAPPRRAPAGARGAARTAAPWREGRAAAHGGTRRSPSSSSMARRSTATRSSSTAPNALAIATAVGQGRARDAPGVAELLGQPGAHRAACRGTPAAGPGAGPLRGRSPGRSAPRDPGPAPCPAARPPGRTSARPRRGPARRGLARRLARCRRPPSARRSERWPRSSAGPAR